MQRQLPKNAVPAQPNDDSNPLSALEATLSCLWILTPLSATVSLGLVATGMVTNQWLHTIEKMPNPAYNGTGEKDFLSKLTVSGLWMFCFTNPGETLYQCGMIDYFSDEDYSPDPNDSSLAIPYTVTKSIIFILLGSIFVLIGYIFCILGQCLRRKTRYTLISGVLFIQTGLIMLCGLIMYIAVFKSEVGSKLRPQSQLQPPPLEYYYGYSFIFYVTGVVFTKISGVSCVFLYIYRAQYEWKRKQYEDYKRGDRPLPVNSFNHIDSTVIYPCKRHPHAYINSNSVVHKHYYFPKELPASPCSLHNARSRSGSVKDVSNFYDFPPPPTISYQFADPPRHFRMPRDATTNTVSTTADIQCDEYLAEQFDDYSPSIQHEHEFVTFDLDQPLPLRTPSVASIASRNGRKNFDNSDTLRRTTPV